MAGGFSVVGGGGLPFAFQHRLPDGQRVGGQRFYKQRGFYIFPDILVFPAADDTTVFLNP